MNSNEVQFKAKSITWNKGDKEGQDKWESLAWNVVSINTERNYNKNKRAKIETVIRDSLTLRGNDR